MPSDRIKRRIDRLLDQAEEAADQNDWQLVYDHARMVLTADPENEDALSMLAMVEQQSAVTLQSNDASTASSDGVTAEVSSEAAVAATHDTADASVPNVSPPSSPAPVIEKVPPARPERVIPDSFADGRYKVVRFLGEGGKKLVYLAHDTLLDRDVAFGLIKAEALDDASLQRVTREAQAIGRLGDHPSIMPIYDFGMEGRQPYMIQPVMGGGDVEALIEDAEDNRLPLARALEVAIAVADGLVFAHSHGIVHRDLKPGNVWLSDDGQARIGDFGLALASGRSRLTREGMMVGTVSYMPPEQATGGVVTERSDLYSLGAMIYELVTGRTPFIGDDEFAIISQHINTPPVSPIWHNAACPRPLDALIMSMLAKNPDERPPDATVVLAELKAIDPTKIQDAPGQASTGDFDGSGDAFIGRSSEIEQLKAGYEDASNAQGRMMTLVGEPGIGKTRMAHEFAASIELRGGQVLWGRCYESDGAPPHWPWIQALRQYVQDRDPTELRRELGTGASAIAEIVSDVRNRLPDIPVSSQAEDGDAARFRLYDAIATFLKTAAREKPIVLVLDDLHWADRASLRLLEFLGRELNGSRILLLGTYRDVDINRQHPLSQALGDLIRDSRFERLVLAGLSREDVGYFIEVVGGMKPQEVLIDKVFDQTEGNPLFVTEVVRLLVEDGQLVPANKNKRDWNVAIPQGVREVVGRRLDHLSDECTKVLTTAAVIGRTFQLAQLDRLIEDMTEDRLLDTLEEALELRLIEEVPGRVGEYYFAHVLTRDTLSEEISLTRRVRLHARIAAAMEDIYGTAARDHAEELAEHFDMARTVVGTEKLIDYSTIAGNKALDVGAFSRALGHFEMAMNATGSQTPLAQNADILAGLGRAQIATLERHQLQRGVSTLRDGFEAYVRSGNIEAALSLAEGDVEPVTGVTRVNEFISRALEVAPPDSIHAGRLYARLGDALGTEKADYENARVAFEKAIDIARKKSDKPLEMMTLINASVVDGHHSDYAAAAEKSAQAVAAAIAMREPGAEMRARMKAVMALLKVGRTDEVPDHFSTIKKLVETYGSQRDSEEVLLIEQGYFLVTGQWYKAGLANTRLLDMTSDPIALGEKAVLEAHHGNAEVSDGYLVRLLDAMSLTPVGPSYWYAMPALVVPLVARLTGDESRISAAKQISESVMRSTTASPERQLYARAGMALAAVAEKDSVAASDHYESILAARHTSFMIGMLLNIDHLLGLLAMAKGDSKSAIAHMEEGLKFCEKAGYRPEMAWICADLSNLLADADTDANVDRIVELQDKAIEVARKLGMTPILEQVIAHREILKA
ncbi:MAG: protein kinase [Chloroflexi bacterium]|nr:protein kinase [Chloroflexota bacterium]